MWCVGKCVVRKRTHADNKHAGKLGRSLAVFGVEVGAVNDVIVVVVVVVEVGEIIAAAVRVGIGVVAGVGVPLTYHVARETVAVP